MVPVGFEPTAQASSGLRSTIGTTGPADLITLLHSHQRQFSLYLVRTEGMASAYMYRAIAASCCSILITTT